LIETTGEVRPCRATKWGKTAENAQWCETWNEDYGSDGRTDKSAYKWATLADGQVCCPSSLHGRARVDTITCQCNDLARHLVCE
jgi:hypothetical protein